MLRNRFLYKYRLFFIFICSIAIILVCISSSLLPTVTRTTENPCEQLCSYRSDFTSRHVIFDQSHMIRHFPNFVCPQNFRNLADWVYAWPDQFNERMEVKADQGPLIAPCLPSGSIIYVRIWDIDKFFKEIYPHLINPFVLITGEGDLSSPTHLEHLHHAQSKIIHWFGQNGQIDVSSSSKFTHIPIGINCYEMADAIEKVYAEHPENTIPSVYDDHDEPSVYTLPIDITQAVVSTGKPKDKPVLINFLPSTDHTGLRRRIWKDTCMSKVLSNQGLYKCFHKNTGVQIENLLSIYQRNRQYPFWLSPRGNGIDCHRTWEALYLDIIPIVWNSTLNILYEDLPVLIINDHKELNETFLYSKLKEISTKKLMEKGAYSYEKLRNSYWRRLILNKSRYAKQRKTFGRSNLCWRAETLNRWKRVVTLIFGQV